MRMSPEAIRRLAEIANVCEIVANYFRGGVEEDISLVPSPKSYPLGNIPPRDMIRVGRYRKLLKVVTETIAGDLA